VAAGDRFDESREELQEQVPLCKKTDLRTRTYQKMKLAFDSEEEAHETRVGDGDDATIGSGSRVLVFCEFWDMRRRSHVEHVTLEIGQAQPLKLYKKVNSLSKIVFGKHKNTLERLQTRRIKWPSLATGGGSTQYKQKLVYLTGLKPRDEVKIEQIDQLKQSKSNKNSNQVVARQAEPFSWPWLLIQRL